MDSHEAPELHSTYHKWLRWHAASHHARRENHGYTPFMSKDAASTGDGDLRDRSLAAAISVALHVAAAAWIWCLDDQAGWGKSETQGHSGGVGMSASFIAADDFRQRIETKLPHASSEVIGTSGEALESAPSVSVDPIVDLPDWAEPVDPAAYPASDATVAEESETAPTKPMELGLNQGGDNAGGNSDDGLQAAYLAALRAAILVHWNHHDAELPCRLTINQSPGGAVKGAATGACSLPPQERRALEAAALMAQPLPYLGFESVYADTITIDF